MTEEGSAKTPIEKLQDDLSKQLDITEIRKQIISNALTVLSNLKNNPIDQFNDPLSKEEIQACLNKCKKILTESS